MDKVTKNTYSESEKIMDTYSMCEQFLLEKLPELSINFRYTNHYRDSLGDPVYDLWFGTDKGLYEVIRSDIHDVMYVRDFSFVIVSTKDDLIKWMEFRPIECPNRQEDSSKHVMCAYCRCDQSDRCYIKARLRSKRIHDQHWRNMYVGCMYTFDKSEFDDIPNCMAIYILILESGRKYVGKSVMARSRLQNQIDKWKNVDPIKVIKILKVENKDNLFKLERKVVDIVNPELNVYLKESKIEIK